MSEEPWTWQCDHVIPSDAGEGRLVLDRVLAELTDRRWPQHDVYSVHLAMEEALVNAIIHGNGRDLSKQVWIRCRIRDFLTHPQPTPPFGRDNRS